LNAIATVATAIFVAIALTACGSTARPRAHRATAEAPPRPSVGTTACRAAGHGRLRAHGVGCATARRIVQGFSAEGGSPGAVLTVDDFVCEDHGRELHCARGTATIVDAGR
jgi:hypothetical protein